MHCNIYCTVHCLKETSSLNQLSLLRQYCTLSGGAQRASTEEGVTCVRTNRSCHRRTTYDSIIVLLVGALYSTYRRGPRGLHKRSHLWGPVALDTDRNRREHPNKRKAEETKEEKTRRGETRHSQYNTHETQIQYSRNDPIHALDNTRHVYCIALALGSGVARKRRASSPCPSSIIQYCII